MRQIFTSISLLLFSFLFFAKPALSQQGKKTPPSGIPGDWYAKAVAAIENREYAINALESAGVYGAINHAQHLGYWFTADGYGVKNFNEDGSVRNIWQAQFLLAGIGREGRLRHPQLIRASQKGDHLLRMDHGDYAVLYDNEKAGMEQSFLIRKRPAGKSSLQVVLKLESGLDARISGKNTLQLYTAGHPEDVKLVYDQLKVWDRNHRLLPATMHLTADHRLVLNVDDRNAVYPVTVDPFSHGFTQTYDVENVLNSGVVDATVHTLFGYSCAGAGDVDGDGLKDIIIGAPTFARITSFGSGTLSLNTSVSVTGAAFIYFGILGNAPSTTPSKVLQPSSIAAGALFGFSVCSTGNAGGGGTHSGVVVGSPGAQATFTYLGTPNTVAIGAAYVFTSNLSGATSLVTAPDATLALTINDFNSGVSQPNRNPLTGFSVADAGDVDGDNIDDIIVGSPLYNDNSSFGRVDIYKGGSGSISTTPQTSIKGTITGEFLGFSVSGAGKVNNDAFADVIIGAPGDVASGTVRPGIAYVFYGASGGITATSDAAVTSTVGTPLPEPGGGTGTLFGFSVSSAGDVDLDGHDDVIVGAPLKLETISSFGSRGANGAAYIYYGSGSADGIGSSSLPIATLTSPRAGAGLNLLFGYSVGNAGNITGDGAGDVLVGEPGSLAISKPIVGTVLSALGFNNISPNVTDNGQAYVFQGNAGTGIGTSARYTATGTAPNLLGESVHTAGDVDGDGAEDFIVGEPSGTLDLGFNLTTLSGLLSGGPTDLSGTLTTATNGGLLTRNSTGNSQLFFGFAGPLPVTLLDFTGHAEQKDVVLNWSTAMEQNSSYFQIERSLDNVHFTVIGKVAAAQNTSNQTNYAFTDASPASGNNYYRLHMVDLDGTSTYSKIVVVNFNNLSEHVIATYPNPAHSSFLLQFRNMTPGRYDMQFMSTAGQLIFTRQIQVADPVSYNETINLSQNLAQGTYLIRVMDRQNHSFVTRIMVE